MKNLIDLVKSLDSYDITGDPDVDILSIEFDSRKVQSGSLYVAQRGTQTDGHHFIGKALENGAAAVICEELPSQRNESTVYITVPSSSVALGRLAGSFFDHPSAKLKLVGITGTNGKTTTVTLLHSLFAKLGYPAGMLSTIQNKIGERIVPSTHTTPDAVQLNSLLHDMVMAGCEYCFMEVSSHAIAQHRIEGLTFAGAIFSNITHDHLDFHETFANYIQAKKAFFDDLPQAAFALTNIDDRNGKVMVQNSKAKIYTYSLLTDADFKGRIIENSFEGLQMSINGVEVFFKLSGKFNAYNILAIYGAAVLLGLDRNEILEKLSNLETAAGRFQLIKNRRGTAIVDYAHTPDALKNVLSTIKDITQNSVEVITVVGCGGDRDALKRPVMAEIACQFSNKVILTSDNPRTEDPARILADMEAGVPVASKRNVLVIENRKEAIKTGCMILEEKGVLLVAGKGHETYQEIDHVRYPFDDAAVIKEFLGND